MVRVQLWRRVWRPDFCVGGACDRLALNHFRPLPGHLIRALRQLLRKKLDKPT